MYGLYALSVYSQFVGGRYATTEDWDIVLDIYNRFTAHCQEANDYDTPEEWDHTFLVWDLDTKKLVAYMDDLDDGLEFPKDTRALDTEDHHMLLKMQPEQMYSELRSGGIRTLDLDKFLSC